MHPIHEIKQAFYTTSQAKNKTLQDYLENFTNVVDVVDYMRGSFGSEPDIIERHLGKILNQASGDQINMATKKDKQEYIALTFILGSSRRMYVSLIRDLDNNFLQGSDQYSKDLNVVYRLLLYFNNDPCDHIFDANKSEGVYSDRVD